MNLPTDRELADQAAEWAQRHKELQFHSAETGYVAGYQRAVFDLGRAIGRERMENRKPPEPDAPPE